METAQIYNFINEVQREALGETAITVKDTSSLVSLGETVLSSEHNTEQWYSTLVDRISKCYIKFRMYTRQTSNIQYEPLEFGAILQKIQVYKIAKAKENHSWNEQRDPFTILEKDETDIIQTFFKKRATWEIDKIVYDYQLRDSFIDMSHYIAFTDLILNDMRVGLEYEIEQFEKLIRATAYAQALKTPNKNCARNLLAEYNTKFNETLTTEECLMNASFLKYASMEINKVVKRFPRMTSLFSPMGADRNCPLNELVVECLADYASATSSYLESGVYHKELVSLPLYEEIDCIQASGTAYDFEDTSRINITDEQGVTIDQNGIIACIRSREQAGVSCYNIRTKTLYNPAQELNNFYHKADMGGFVDMSENICLFYVADETDSAPTLTTSVPTSATQLGSKTAGDIQEGISINGTVVTGVAKYVTGYSDMFPLTPNGNFVALKFETDESAELSAKLVNAKQSSEWKTLDDGILVTRIADKDSQYVIVKSVMGDKTTENIIRFDRLTLETV